MILKIIKYFQNGALFFANEWFHQDQYCYDLNMSYPLFCVSLSDDPTETDDSESILHGIGKQGLFSCHITIKINPE